LRIVKGFGDVFLHRQAGIGEIEDVRDIRCQLSCGIGEPHSMKMCLNEVAIGKVERPDRSVLRARSAAHNWRGSAACCACRRR
jgi:hypothetical protein